MTSNIIAPGQIDSTEGMTRLTDMSSDGRHRAAESVPVQRLGLVRDIADATVFLFGDTGNYINGVCIDVDGGAWRVRGGAQWGGRPYPASVKPGSGSRL
jgi:2,4-dienoyl-CoA reductase [(3E)-enoyl-CoA-producing], peroxisomal